MISSHERFLLIANGSGFFEEGTSSFRPRFGGSGLPASHIQTIFTRCSTFLNSGSPVTKAALCSTAEVRAKQSA